MFRLENMSRKNIQIEKVLRKDIHQERPSILCKKDGGPSDLQASVLDGAISCHLIESLKYVASALKLKNETKLPVYLEI